MRVEAITLRKLKMRLKAPFEISFDISDERSVILVELLAGGLTGWSEITVNDCPFSNAETLARCSVPAADS